MAASATVRRAKHRLQVDQARAFVEVARLGSYDDAADLLGSEARSVRKLITRFAAALGTGALLTPSSGGRVYVTSAGAAALPHAQAFVDDAAALLDSAPRTRFSTYPSLAVRVAGTVDTVELGIEFQGVSWQARRDGGQGLIDRLATGEVDVVAAPSGLGHDGIEERHLYAWKLRAVTFKKTSARSVSPSALSGRSLLVAPRGHRSRGLAEDAFRRSRQPFHVALELEEQGLLRALAEQAHGRYVALIPDDAFGPPDSTLGPVLQGVDGELLGGNYSLYIRSPVEGATVSDQRRANARESRTAAVRAIQEALEA